VLKVWWQDDGFVASFARKLDAEIPRIESDEGELKIIGQQVLLRERVETVDGITERSSCTDMFPSQSRQTGCNSRDVSYCSPSI